MISSDNDYGINSEYCKGSTVPVDIAALKDYIVHQCDRGGSKQRRRVKSEAEALQR